MGEDDPPFGGGGGGRSIPARRAVADADGLVPEDAREPSEEPAVEPSDPRAPVGLAAEGDDHDAEEVAQLHARIGELEDQLAEQSLTISRLSVRATEAENELEQAKSRIQREALKDAKKQRHDLLRGLLEVADNFDRALSAHTADQGDLAQGVRLVRQHFLKTLAEYGVEPMDSQGKLFSPQLHDAISTMATSDPAMDGAVAHVAQPGYLVGDEVLRPARVVVAKLSS